MLRKLLGKLKRRMGVVNISGSLSADKISGTTGRSGQVLNQDSPTLYGPVKALVQELSQSSPKPFLWLLIIRPIAWKICREIAAVRTVGLKGVYYRSRRFPIDVSKPTPTDLGPPPPGRQGSGRYTAPGSAVLYMSRTAKTAALESEEQPGKPRLFIQKFALSLPQVSVIELDPSLEARAPALNFLLLESEYLPDISSIYPYPYHPSQFLAYLCRKRGILAIEYPSVRANYKSDTDAVNIAILGDAVELAAAMTSGEPYEYVHAA